MDDSYTVDPIALLLRYLWHDSAAGQTTERALYAASADEGVMTSSVSTERRLNESCP